MKKVDDEKLLEMLEQGIEQKEIAAHFGCAPSYISKRKKQLMPPPAVEEPEVFATLSEPQKKFVIAKVEGKTNVQAALDSYEVVSRDSAKSLGCEMMKNPVIQQSIAELMDNNDLSKEKRIKQLKTLVYHRDGNISLKALDQTWKLDGSYQPEQPQSITYEQVQNIAISLNLGDLVGCANVIDVTEAKQIED